MKIFLAIAVVLAALFVYRLRSLAVASRSMPPPGPGFDGKLTPCPSPMRCVSSDDAGEAHIAPLAVTGTPEEIQRKVVAAIEKMGGVIRLSRPDYILAEFHTRLFRFVDDVEIRIPAAGGPVGVRSGSRVGKSDLGANRKRVELLRSTLGK